MISVCIATYNGERFVRQQIESILPQLSPGDEVVVSDDGSTDGTVKAIEAIGSPMVRVVVNKGEHGYTANFEHALRQAKGDLIFLADQDDVWQPDKVETMGRALQEATLAVSDAEIVDEQLRPLHYSYYAERGVYRSLAGNLLKFGYLGCCMAFRRELLQKALPFPADRRLCTHDNWLFLVAKAFFSAKVLDERLVLYRRHRDTASTGAVNKGAPACFRAKYRLYLIGHLLKRI